MAEAKAYPPTTDSGHYVQRAVITKNRIAMKRAVARFLKGQVKRVAHELATYAGLSKAADDASNRAKSAVDHVKIDWTPLADQVEPYLAAVAVAGGSAAAKGLDITLPDDFGADMRKRAEDWASERSAELVGMKREGEFLVPNPNAFWQISDTTRDMIQAYVTNAIEEGDSTGELARRLANSFAFSDERAEMIARTEIAKADSEGALIGWKATGAVSGKSWLTAEDDRVSDECMANQDAGVVSLNHVYDDGVTAPPQHPNCLPGNTRVLAASVTATSERRYDGDLIVIRTASGKHLSCTPNHPILTPGGWVAAGLLHKGGHVVGARVGQWGPTINLDDEDVPPRVEDVAEAFRRSDQMAAMPVPTAPEHFHGDGEGSEVAVIRADRLLLDASDAALGQHSLQPKLKVGGVQLLRHDGSGALNLLFHRMLSTANGFMGSGDLSGASSLVEPDPFERLGLALTAALNPGLSKDAGDDISGDSGPLGKDVLGNTGLIFADNIVDVQTIPFSGHVYNLQTVEGFYIAQGIVTHNCRCVILPELIEGIDDKSE